MKGKNCVVTGGNSGIGFETARALAEEGANVLILSRNEEK
ncbi:SDR family NAD(P)-dependent oxidoreductase, partial [Robiginitalea sp.]